MRKRQRTKLIMKNTISQKKLLGRGDENFCLFRYCWVVIRSLLR